MLTPVPFPAAVAVALATALTACARDLAPPVRFAILPRFAAVTADRTRQFGVATRSGAVWSVAEGATGGRVGPDGLYTAPHAPGTYHLVATSKADASEIDAATVTVVAPRGGAAPMPVISRNAPAFGTGDPGSAAFAVDDDYGTQWRSPLRPTEATPAWIALDLSAQPSVRRGRVVVAWYADGANFDYDQSLSGAAGYDLPNRYTIEAHAAPGGGAPPADGDPGWTILAAVTTPNALHSRQHVVELTKGATTFNWLRLRVTDVRGSQDNDGVALNLDVHDAHLGLDDDWIVFGSSTTAAVMNHDPRAAACPAPCPYGGAGVFGQLVAARRPEHLPLQEGGGQVGLGVDAAAANLPRWLAAFPGKWVGLAYGANDAWSAPTCDAACADVFYARYESMVQAVLAAGKVPIVPTIPWSALPRIQRNAPVLNERIRWLWTAYPQIVPGPDLWELGAANPHLISEDGVHPTPLGAYAYRSAWAEAMLASVYAEP